MPRRLIILLLALGVALPGRAEAPAVDSTTPAAATTNAAIDSDALLRSVLILQEQLKATQREIQQAREAADTAARHTTEILNERLNFLEQKQIDTLQSSNRLTLMVVGIIAAIACIAVILSGFVQTRAVNRLAEISRQLDELPALWNAAHRQLAFNGHDSVLPSASAVTQTTDVASSVQRVQQRLNDLEQLAANGTSNGNGSSRMHLPVGSSAAATLIAKGQALLNLEQTEEALNCFEEATMTDAKNIEAWIKKGTALEKLQRVDEAIAAYDQAIACDEATATAYLFKAGVFNRQKRYAEALECYEKALAVQKSRPQRAG